MKIVGVDLHAKQQSIAMLDNETGELTERVIRHEGNALRVNSWVCLFAGENGTGKSTVLEAIAAHHGFGREGGEPRRDTSPSCRLRR